MTGEKRILRGIHARRGARTLRRFFRRARALPFADTPRTLKRVARASNRVCARSLKVYRLYHFSARAFLIEYARIKKVYKTTNEASTNQIVKRSRTLSSETFSRKLDNSRKLHRRARISPSRYNRAARAFASHVLESIRESTETTKPPIASARRSEEWPELSSHSRRVGSGKMSRRESARSRSAFRRVSCYHA